MSLRAFERTVTCGAAGMALALLVWAMFAARCSPEHDAALLERARGAATHAERCRAMNALCLRGYWEARPTSDLGAFLSTAPPDVREFVREAHFTLLDERRTGTAGKAGC
ncbi:MAG: hypothetical protein R3F49_01860 [Planctomycetota bacterium]